MKASVFISWLLYCWTEKWGYIWGKCGILWTQKRQDNLVAKYNADPSGMSNYKSAAQYGKKWIGHFVADCANLLRWAAKKSGDDGVHSGSNLIWQCDLSARGELKNGQRTDGQPLKPGTYVFTGANYNEHPHVGGYIGNGEVIEDVGTLTGVAKSKITADKWRWWGERKGMEFDVKEGEYVLPAEDTENPGENAPNQPDEPADDNSDTQTLPTLRKGDKGDAVRYMQTLLLDRGYDLGKWGADGDFGSATEKALKQFQRDWNLKQDGVCGKNTWAMLTSTPEKPVFYTVTITHLPESTADEVVNKYGGIKTAE